MVPGRNAPFVEEEASTMGGAQEVVTSRVRSMARRYLPMAEWMAVGLWRSSQRRWIVKGGRLEEEGRVRSRSHWELLLVSDKSH